MKKLYFLVLVVVVFLITGCTADYTLTYEDGLLKEHMVIVEENASDKVFGLGSVESNPNMLKIDDNSSYDYKFTKEGKKITLVLDYTYDKVSFEKSKVIQSCFTSKFFVDNDDYYYFKGNGNSCEYLKNANITFKTDMKVLMNNADKVDEKTGTYTWENYTKGEIMFQVSKKITAKKSSSAKKNSSFVPWYVKIIIIFAIVGVGGFLIIRLKENLK